MDKAWVEALAAAETGSDDGDCQVQISIHSISVNTLLGHDSTFHCLNRSCLSNSSRQTSRHQQQLQEAAVTEAAAAVAAAAYGAQMFPSVLSKDAIRPTRRSQFDKSRRRDSCQSIRTWTQVTL